MEDQTTPTPRPEPEPDPRFTTGLLFDVLRVLDSHGYRCASDRALGAVVGILGVLVATYEGAPL